MARFLKETELNSIPMRKSSILALAVAILIQSNPLSAQNTPFVEYLKGDIPLLISVPHGGYEKPVDIPERDGRFAKNQDIYTIEIARIIYQEMYRLTGQHPHIVINHLHRTRLDANRDIREAANGNPDAEAVWKNYQSNLDSVASFIEAQYGAGLFIDLHGHRHSMERIELGYLLSAEEIRLDDELLNSGLLNEYSSIRRLLESNEKCLTTAGLIRGKESLGNMLFEQGQNVVPCSQHPWPQEKEPYFSGGYNTTRHGSSNGGNIDGIQIEIDLQTRSDAQRQEQVAKDIAQALTQFLKTHYTPPW